MREIKFRAWEKSTEDMVYWDILILKPSVFIEEVLKGDEFIPMQYTGLHDKNGKEIYEGDIVRCRWEKIMIPKDIKVEWDICGWNPFNLVSDIFKGYKPKNYEVIGNIYENPDLLKALGEGEK